MYFRRRLGALLSGVALVLTTVALAGGVPSSGGEPGSEEFASGRGFSDTRPAEPAPPATDRENPEAAEKETAGASRDEGRAAGGEPLNILVLGVDERPEGSFVEGSRADTIMVARVSPGSGQVRLLSVPRDLFVEVRPGVEDRINAAYSHGDVAEMTAALEKNFGLSVERHAVIDFGSFEQIIDALGGVTLDVGSDLPPGWRLGEGVQKVDGRHALLYARYRGTAGGDLDRIARQQKLVAAVREQALGWKTLPRLPGTVAAVDRTVETDVSPARAVSLARTLAAEDDPMTTVQLRGDPAVLPDGRQVLLPDRGENERVLQEFTGR